MPARAIPTDCHIQTRQKLKEAYDIEFLATIERAEKQIILAKHGRRLLNLLDDSPVVPGDTRAGYEHGAQARQILDDAEDDLRDWRPSAEPIEEFAPPAKGDQEPALGETQPASEEVVASGALVVEEESKTDDVAQ